MPPWYARPSGVLIHLGGGAAVTTETDLAVPRNRGDVSSIHLSHQVIRIV